MKNFKLEIIVSAAILSIASLAQAESSDKLNHNFISKRAYQAPMEHNKVSQADEQFEGATLITENHGIVESKNARNLKQLKINLLAKRY